MQKYLYADQSIYQTCQPEITENLEEMAQKRENSDGILLSSIAQ